MSGEPSKTGGNLTAAGGTVKDKIGGLIGNDQMQAEGKAKNVEGHAEHDTAQAKGYVEGMKDTVVGSVKDAYGALTGDKSMQAEGKTQNLTGDVKKASNS